MRETKELLEIVLDEFEKESFIKYRYSGICACIRFLWFNSLIAHEEKRFLFEFIKENRPEEGKYFDVTYMNYAWFWKPGLKPPRIAWLKHLIQKTQ